MIELTDAEREEVIAAIRAGQPLPTRYRASLFEDASETELVWPGKTSDVERIVLPFQSIEHIDEPRSGTVKQPDLFSMSSITGRQAGGWTNKLIWGDNKLILSSLANGPLRKQIEDAGGLKLVYIDPPFDVGADFSVDVEVGGSNVYKEPSIVEQMAYRDTWGRGRDSFVAMLYVRLNLISSLLADNASIFVHVDWRVNSSVRLLLDEVFGPDSYKNEISWCYSGPSNTPSHLPRKHDSILFYAVGDPFFNQPRIAHKSGVHNTGQIFGSSAEGDVEKQREMESKGKALEDWWTDIYATDRYRSELVGYPTQKPVALLKRIIEMASSPGDLVADFFSGSGTTLAVAEMLGRKWIGADLGRFAIHSARKRLIGIQRELAASSQTYRAFEILNLGSYERQFFAGVDPTLPDEVRRTASLARQEAFFDLVMSAYGGQRSSSMPGFQGVKDSAFVFVGPLDAPVTQDDVRKAISTARKNNITRVDILGFEFEMGIKPAMADEAKEDGLTLTLRYIPNDVFDKRAIAKGQVKFHDVGYLEVTAKQDSKTKKVTVSISDFGVFYSQDDADVAVASLKNGASKVIIDGGQVVRISKDKKGKATKEILTKSWTDWIDYWAVDFDFESQKEIIAVEEDGVTKDVWTGRYIFENQWQDFRSKGSRDLVTSSEAHSYDTPGEYKIAVKVVDIFGNDTTKVVTVKVK